MNLPPEVLDAFGVAGEPRRLAGGKGGTWRAGEVVLKPAEGVPETVWRSEARPDDAYRPAVELVVAYAA